MDDVLLNYFSERLTTAGRAFGCRLILHQRDFSGTLLPLAYSGEEEPSLTIHSGELTVPVVFGDSPLGELQAKGTMPPKAKLEALAQQIASVWQLGEPEIGIKLDRRIEELTKQFANFDWCGIYRRVGDQLFLTAFRGEATPHPIIPLNRGICGAAVSENRTLNIGDVSKDPRYLSCDLRTKSELVVPIRRGSEAIAEIDIDSHTPNAFNTRVVTAIEIAATELAPLMIELV